MSLELMMPSNHLFCHPLLLLPSVLPSIRIFSIESAFHIRWPKYWSFNFSISPSNEYSWLISFRIDWFDLFAVQGTLQSLLQHHNLKASIHWHSDFFMVQLSYPYMTTGQTTTVIIWTFVGKVTSLLLNMVSGFVIAFLPRSKCLLISWLLISITVCSHEIKRCLLLRKEVITNLDSILKSRDITLPTKVHLVKAVVFPVVRYGCESWTIKKAEC